jgi:hypothetical protein
MISSPWRGLLLLRGTIDGSKFTEKGFAVPWVFVGRGSGAPAGGSVIGPTLAPARYTTTTILYHDQSQQPLFLLSLFPTGWRVQDRMSYTGRIPLLYREVQNQLHPFTLFSSFRAPLPRH